MIVVNMNHLEDFSCRECLSAENVSIRLKPSHRIPSKKVQKLLTRKLAGEEITGKHNINCVNKYMKHTNVLLVKCKRCQWQCQKPVRSREHGMLQKSLLQTSEDPEEETAVERVESPVEVEVLDAKTRKKLRKKEKKKAAKKEKNTAERGQQSILRPSGMKSPPVNSPLRATTAFSSPTVTSIQTLSRPAAKTASSNVVHGQNANRNVPAKKKKDSEPRTALPAHSMRKKKSDFQQNIKNMLRHNAKKNSQTASSSLAQFLGSLK